MPQEFFLYKGRPLVRNKDTIYYGRMSDPYVVMMQIKSHRDFSDLSLAETGGKKGALPSAGHCLHLAGPGMRSSKLK